MTIGKDGPGVVTLGLADRGRAIAAIKAALRIETVVEDVLITGLAESAMGLAEQFLGQMLIVRPVEEILPSSAQWQRLAAAPVRAITAVAGVRADASEFSLAVTDYAIDIDARGDGWVRMVDAGDARRVRAICTAGLVNDWDSLPGPLRQGVVMLGAYLFSERDTARPPPSAITALWRPFRAATLARAVYA